MGKLDETTFGFVILYALHPRLSTVSRRAGALSENARKRRSVMPILHDRPAYRLFEFDLLDWAVPEPRTFYDAQLLRCRIGFAGEGFDVRLKEPALYRWEVDFLLFNLEEWLAGRKTLVSFRFCERMFGLTVSGQPDAEIYVDVSEAEENALRLQADRDSLVGFRDEIFRQCTQFPPRGRQWPELFTQHYPAY
jgi:hypothetical protein